MSDCDPTEDARRAEVARINANPGTRESLEAQYGVVWDTKELQADFEVLSFLAPYVHVRRKSDGVCGTLEFQHMPRFYYEFHPEK